MLIRTRADGVIAAIKIILVLSVHAQQTHIKLRLAGETVSVSIWKQDFRISATINSFSPEISQSLGNSRSETSS